MKFTNYESIPSKIEQSEKELPAASGPPPNSDPLTWGFYGTKEIQTPTHLEIEGSFPKWLEGSLYRGAAGTWDVGTFTAEHWLDGFSRNHRFEIADGSVTYRSRNSTDELMDFVRETGLYPDGSIGTDPCKIIYGALETTFRDGDHPKGAKSSTNVGVAFIPNFTGMPHCIKSEGSPLGNLVVTTDANYLLQIDPVSLEPIEISTYQAAHPLLKNDGRTAAHPIYGPNGSIFNYLLDMSKDLPVYHIFGIHQESGKADILATINDAPPSYIHAMFGTRNHLILVVWQADIVKEGRTLLESLGPWDPKRRTLFYVIDRVNGGVVSKYEAEDAFFAFHQINSFEDETGDIFVDLPVMKDYSFLTAASIHNLRANLGPSHGPAAHDLPASFIRYRLPFHGDKGKGADGSLVKHTAEVVFALPHVGANIELPRINKKHYGLPYQYAYGIHVETFGTFADSIIKIDTYTKEVKVWSPAKKHLPCEPIFVQAPGGEREDDGVVLTVAMDTEKRLSSLVVIDATTMEELGRARMPIVMGYGFHGMWAPAE